MVTNRYLIFISLLVFAGCQTKIKEDKPPANLIADSTMRAVLVDVHLAEGASQVRNIPVADFNKYQKDQLLIILRFHHLDEKQFMDSYQYYSDHPAKLGLIYEGVINELSKLQAESVNGNLKK